MVTRYQITSPEHPEVMHVEHEANRVYGNAVKYQHNPLAVDHRGSVLATRLHVRGADTVRIDPNNEGSRTHIGQAVKLGLLVETAPGYFIDAPKAAPAAKRVPPTLATPAPAPVAPTPPAAPAAQAPSTAPVRFEQLPGFYDAEVPDFGF